MFRRLLAAIAALFVFVLALLIWRLSQGPISLAFAEPYLEEAVRGDSGDWRLEIDELLLMPDLKIHARNVNLAADDTSLLRVPDMVVRPSLRALLSGLVAISAVEISGAEAHVLRRPDGSFGLTVGGASAEVAESEANTELLEDLLQPVSDDRAIGFLRHFRVIDARLSIRDVETNAGWTIRNANLELARGRSHHQLSFRAALAGGKKDDTVNLDSRLDVRPAGDGFTLDGEARASGIDAGRLDLYWPENAAGSARRWVKENIKAGTIDEAVVNLIMASTKGTDFRLAKLEGNLRYHGLSVRWDDSAPPVTGVGGTAVFDASSMRFAISSGQSRSIRVRSGRVNLFDLDTDKEQISIDVKGEGPLADVVGLVPDAADKIPLRIAGDAGIDLQVAFPLSARLSFADVTLKVDADPREVRVQHDTGSATVAGRLRYQKRARRTAALTADLDVTAAHVDVGEFEWRQPSGEKGALQLSIDFDDGPLTLEPLRIDCPGLRARGSVAIHKGGAGGSARLRHIAYGASALDRADVEWSATRLKADIGAGSLDLSPLIGDGDGRGGSAKQARPIDLEIETGLLHRVVFDADSWLENVRATFVRNNAIWRKIDVRSELPKAMWSEERGANAGGKKTFVLGLEPSGTGWRVEGKADDFGALLQAVNLTNGVRGGVLEIAGRADRDGEGAMLRTHVKVTGFVVREAPLALRILTVAALDKFVSTLKGEGLQFDSLKGVLIARGERYQLENVRAHGSSLGWTADGWIDTAQDTLKIQGAVIPAYQANKVLKKIPLIGGLLTGPKGRGFIAVTYAVGGQLRDPKVTTNPLTALTPGFLREVWEIGK